MTDIVCISDTHGRHEGLQLPAGRLLLHAGDLTSRGTLRELAAVCRWLRAQPFERVVVIAGNHDRCFQRSPRESRGLIEEFGIYLEDEAYEWEGLNIYGTPWQPKFFNWAFNLPRGAPLREKWSLIPDDTDILVTHTPPRFTLDRTRFGQSVGCEELVHAIARVKPRIHLFGHIHEGYGVRCSAGVMSINASTCTVRYAPTQPPVALNWNGGQPRLLSGGA